jgi:hypothetical protein
MKKTFFVFSLVLGAMLSHGCSTVTIRDKGSAEISRDANYDSSQAFFFWGLAGEKHIDVREICDKRQVEQLQTQRSFVDGVLTVITLGIYSPRTARVWCARTQERAAL